MNYIDYMSSFLKLSISKARAAENFARDASLCQYVIASCHIRDLKDIN